MGRWLKFTMFDVKKTWHTLLQRKSYSCTSCLSVLFKLFTVFLHSRISFYFKISLNLKISAFQIFPIREYFKFSFIHQCKLPISNPQFPCTILLVALLPWNLQLTLSSEHTLDSLKTLHSKIIFRSVFYVKACQSQNVKNRHLRSRKLESI